MTDRQVGVEGLNVDIIPISQRQTHSLGITVDFTTPPGVKVLGAIGLMIDYIGSLVPTNAARWSGLAFETGTASPLAYWSSGAFRATGSNPVVWVTDHFEVAP